MSKELIYKELIKKALEAKEFAYCPYSNYKVGAALLTRSGKIYMGCNIENASFGATNCAERTAIFKAVSKGDTDFVAIAIVTSSNDFAKPCGICRQVIAEFMDDDAIILCADKDGNYEIYTVGEMIPHAFRSFKTT